MSDITTVWRSADGQGDWVVDGKHAVLQNGNDLPSAVLISLFTDRRAHDDDKLVDETDNRRGWWGDADLGSRLWLLERAKETTQTLLLARGAALEALQWLLDDAIASKIDVQCFWARRFMLGMKIVITKTDGTLLPLQYDWVWKGLTQNAV